MHHPLPSPPSSRAGIPWLAAGGIAGPTAFIGAWALAGERRAGYSHVDQAISRLAEVHSPTQALMTVGFVTFGLGVPLFGLALHRAVPGAAGIAALVTGVATLAVAALPLGAGVDVAHGAAASVGYASLAALPALAARDLVTTGRRRWTSRSVVASLAVASVAAGSLVLTAFSERNGLWQRVGLTAGDVWIVAAALWLIVGRPTPQRRSTPSRSLY